MGRRGRAGAGDSGRARGRAGVERARKPRIIVVLDMESRAERVMNGGMMMVQKAMVNSVKWFSRSEARGQKSEINGMVSALR